MTQCKSIAVQKTPFIFNTGFSNVGGSVKPYEEEDQQINQLNNDNSVCSTAPANPGMLILSPIAIFVVSMLHSEILCEFNLNTI